jgi:multidrug efflux system membrane fusion protein
VITQLSPVSVVFTLPEDDLGAVMARMKAGATLEATAFDRTNSTQLATGKLTAVDSQIDPTTGTVKLRAEFANEDQKLFPNQFVNVSLLVDALQDATVIPAAAIQRGTDGTFVYVVKPDNTVAMKPVKTGVADGDRIQITEGELNPGDQVVVDGADKLKDGAKIALPSPEEQNGDKKSGAPDGEAKGGHRHDGNGATNDIKEPSPANPAVGADAKTPGTPAAAESPNTRGSQGTPDNGAPSAAFGQKKETDAPAGNPPVPAPALGRSAQ